jgi:OmpA-OmpF porin, OOP family
LHPPTRRVSLRPFFTALLAISAGLALCPQQAAAQQAEGEFSVQRFNPAAGPRNYFITRGARTDGEMAWSAGLFANYGWAPFAISTVRPDGFVQDVEVVENVVTADVLASLTPIPRLQIGLKVPVTWVKGQGLDPEDGSATEDGISATGMGDPELEAKVRVYGDLKQPFVLGVAAFGTAPLGHATSEGNYMGDTSPNVGGRLIIDGEHGPFGFGANVGGVWREEARVAQTKVGAEMRWGVALGYRFGPALRVVVDSLGTTRFTSNPGENTLEGLLGLQVSPLGSALTISAGAGPRIVEGLGAPKLRAFLGFIYSAEAKDRDGDGKLDAEDACPTDAEDLDNHEDGDGCPDLDNDLDDVPDSADKCVMQAEDPDTFEDADGCPEFDNDKDGVNDDGDRCPEKAETKNGFQDEDGCPDAKDTDADGVADEADKCINEVEDTDGFEDTDGCPDPDNDKDGVEDSDDECAEEPETVNEFEDQDGCPDEAPAAPAVPAAKPRR